MLGEEADSSKMSVCFCCTRALGGNLVGHLLMLCVGISACISAKCCQFGMQKFLKCPPGSCRERQNVSPCIVNAGFL